jgi:hypothetical protein
MHFIPHAHTFASLANHQTPSYGPPDLVGGSIPWGCWSVGAAAIDKASNYLRIIKSLVPVVEDALVWAASPLVHHTVYPAASC